LENLAEFASSNYPSGPKAAVFSNFMNSVREEFYPSSNLYQLEVYGNILGLKEDSKRSTIVKPIRHGEEWINPQNTEISDSAFDGRLSARRQTGSASKRPLSMMVSITKLEAFEDSGLTIASPKPIIPDPQKESNSRRGSESKDKVLVNR
jgi:hypothetical protein